MKRFHVVFTFHRVWYFLNCRVYPQNSQLSIKLTLLAFKVLDCIVRTHSCQSNECFWLLKYFRLSSWKQIPEHSNTWCSLNASMNKNTKNEWNRRALKAKNMSQKSSLEWNFTTMRNKKLIYLQFRPKKPQNDVHLQWTWCSLRSKICKFTTLVKPF